MIIEKTNVFQDQERFMQACDQTTHKQNKKQFKMYHKLIKEEVKELKEAIKLKNTTEILDALIDILVVTIGAGHSMGFNMEGAWNEVMKTNFAKINSETGKVIKREDGKVLKPEGWEEPKLEEFLNK
jgi:predicted HAD superfamily Cof-like phosphohydrolase